VLETLYLSAITVAELRAGTAPLPAGKRRDSLPDNLEIRLLPMFANRVLSFDMACTTAYAGLLAKSRAVGSAIETADAFIGPVVRATTGLYRDQAGPTFIDRALPMKVNPSIQL